MTRKAADKAPAGARFYQSVQAVELAASKAVRALPGRPFLFVLLVRARALPEIDGGKDSDRTDNQRDLDDRSGRAAVRD
jgi:hypothetical protein